MSRGKYDRSQTAAERQLVGREHLLDTATEVFAAKSVAGTRVDDLVERAGISRRTLYQHFASVDAVLDAVYERAVRNSFMSVFEALAGISDPIERIHEGVRAYFRIIADNPSAARVVFVEYRYAGPAQAAKYELNTTRYAALLLEFLNAAFAGKRLGRPPDETSAYALTRALEAVGVRAILRGEPDTLAALAPQMSMLILEAFRFVSP
ncbi:MAG TPA: TetR/AcrR family transcriptional regulator [Kofleriaceae bacterium]|jgi:AcrR family transcriptional regulator